MSRRKGTRRELGDGLVVEKRSSVSRDRRNRALSDPAPASELVTGSPAKLASLATSADKSDAGGSGGGLGSGSGGGSGGGDGKKKKKHRKEKLPGGSSGGSDQVGGGGSSATSDDKPAAGGCGGGLGSAGGGGGGGGSGDDGGDNNRGSGRIYPADWATKTKGQKKMYWKRRRQSGKGPPGP